MTHCVQRPVFFSYRKRRRERMLKKMANMRLAKERKPVEPEPKFIRWCGLELGVRDKRTGEVAWVDLKSVRDAARRLAVLLKFYNCA